MKITYGGWRATVDSLITFRWAVLTLVDQEVNLTWLIITIVIVAVLLS
jgi:hypothetical protein